jgi:hypothetical protein
VIHESNYCSFELADEAFVIIVKAIQYSHLSKSACLGAGLTADDVCLMMEAVR